MHQVMHDHDESVWCDSQGLKYPQAAPSNRKASSPMNHGISPLSRLEVAKVIWSVALKMLAVRGNLVFLSPR
jgi:hypothetical protein